MTRQWLYLRRYQVAAVCLFALVAAVIGLTFLDYGITWDEENRHRHGRIVVDHYRSLLEGRPGPLARVSKALVGEAKVHLYGGVFDGLAAFVSQNWSLGVYETRHLLGALFGLLGVLGCWKLANLVGGPRAAFVAALILIVIPRYYGHMFNNSKDIPFAVGYVWSVYYIAALVARLPRPPIALMVKLGLAVGLTLGVRIGGLVLFAYLGLGVLLFLVLQSGGGAKRRLVDALKAGAIGVFVCAVSYGVMVLCWPWAQQDPLRNPWLALEKMSRFDWNMKVLFAGEITRATDLPRGYIWHYLAITLPELVLLLLGLGLGIVGSRVIRLRQLRWRDMTPTVIVLVALVFPLFYVSYIKAVLYDGMRHLLFVVPIAACCCGLAFEWLLRRVQHGQRPLALALALGGVFCVLIAAQVYANIRLHPYQTIYFNQLVGGVRGAAGRYETDYWGSANREAALRLGARVARLEGPKPRRPYRVRGSAVKLQVEYYLPPGLRYAARGTDADFYIGVTRWDRHLAVAGTTLFEVERHGVPLVVVKDLRRPR